MTDDTGQPWATHEPPWAGLLDKLAGRQPARDPAPRHPRTAKGAEQLADELDYLAGTHAQLPTALMNPATIVDTAPVAPDTPTVVARETLDCRFCNPQPPTCEVCGETFRDELRRRVHIAVYADPDAHEEYRHRNRRWLPDKTGDDDVDPQETTPAAAAHQTADRP